MAATEQTSAHGRGGRRLFPFLIVIVGVAAAVRTFGLGSFSMWLDEILLVERSRGTWATVWAACVGNGEHPPLSALALNLGARVGLTDPLLRLVPVVAALGGLVLLLRWTARVFDRRVALIAGLVAAFSPFHLRYSQELRPYAFLLLFLGLALVVGERLTNEPRPRHVVLVAVALALGLYSHILAVLVLVPLATRAAEIGWGLRSSAAKRFGRRLGALGLAAGFAFAAWTPWLLSIRHVADRPPPGGVRAWTLDLVARRWQYLVAGVNEGEALTWSGTLLAILALIGVVAALRRRGGPTVIVGAVAGTVGVELLLRQADHWTQGRYNVAGWPFLLLLIALGLDALWRLPRTRSLAGVAALLAVMAGELQAVAASDRRGRPHWDLVADAVDHARRAGEPIFVENPWTRISLGHYLRGRHPGAPEPIALDGDVTRLATLWPAGSCALYLTAGVPRYHALRAGAARFPLLASFPRTDAASLFLLTPSVRQELFREGLTQIGDGVTGPGHCDGGFRALPFHLRREPDGRLAALFRTLQGQDIAAELVEGPIDFDSRAVPALVSGWSGPELTGDGTSFIWALGRRSVLLLRRSRTTGAVIAFRAWPYTPPGTTQTVELWLNGVSLGTVKLADGPNDVRLAAPATAWRTGENQLQLDFAVATRPSDLGTSSGDRRELAAAFDWLSVEEQPGNDS